MADLHADWSQPATFDASHLDRLIASLRALGYAVFGPRVGEDGVVIDRIDSAAMLPAGWEDHQERGRYTLTRTESPRLFGITHGAQSWKRLLHPPTVRLWRAERGPSGVRFIDGEPAPPPMALLGVRPCELKAIHVQDGVLLDPPESDVVYRARREPAFIIVVQCARAGGTCFCASMDTGPRSRAGFDLALTEMVGPEGHWFLAEVGTHRGAEVLMMVPSRPATAREIASAERSVADVSAHMGRHLDTTDLPARLAERYTHPHWGELETRCLACGNCTLVCPTCFCTTVQDDADLSDTTSDRVRHWDTCFSPGFSYIHGGSVRPSTQARYRQWLMHKLSTWHAQFGTSGCVGCGRCITWCPVGIDLTDEARAVADGPAPHARPVRTGKRPAPADSAPAHVQGSK
jgi:sulfhydrogenase subunit beta (sulfur reductase)